jgi:hypothetical protein
MSEFDTFPTLLFAGISRPEAASACVIILTLRQSVKPRHLPSLLSQTMQAPVHFGSATLV